MSSSVPVNPVEVARIALKRIAERGLPPTPENYAQFYNAIVTIKAPESKSSSEVQAAWEVLYKVEDLVEEANAATGKLLDVLEGGGRDMAASLGALNNVRRSHTEKAKSHEEVHSAMEDLLNQIIQSTHSMHSTVSTSHSDLRIIRESILHIEEDLSFSRRMMEEDALTGAFNRQSLDHLLVREVKRASRSDGRLAAVLFEIEDFGQINERLGHVVADQLLVHVANLTKAVLRETDTLVRYGVEEFLLLLPETDLSGCKYVVDRLKLVTGNTPFIYKNQRIEIRFAAGIAALKQDENGRALVLRADEALYKAKHSGRDRIEVAQ
ncbi:diguanylate cyclase (GGDEF) domain-containing protein [Formivibrio citricus]|uniref:diguanylate cyclase n=1 Tax=Formivibrio citricus TaxID=83765 RepID=A0A1I4XY77_9NEIS|nr:GGDEF domain-containing protein [Formivibrio citricus]SFN30794.1 diguanylate cyclase (GGDEF) domain-containing protein [Formivibrio citricus]